MREAGMQFSLWKRYGWIFIPVLIFWLLTHALPLPPFRINVWFWMFLLIMFPMFGLNEIWGDWFRHQSKTGVVFPEFKDSSNSRISSLSLDIDPTGAIPPYETILHNGTNSIFNLRDKSIAVVPVRSVELFGKQKNWRLIHAPVVPIPADALVGFFGGSLNVAKEVSYIKEDSPAWFSLLNSLQGEDIPSNMQFMDEFRLHCIRIQQSRGMIETGEKELIESLKELHREMGKQSWFAKQIERVKKVVNK